MRKITVMLIMLLFFTVMIPVGEVVAFDETVKDFNRVWYDKDSGFNKNGNGLLILAVTDTDNNLKTIDYCNIEYNEKPFYFGISFKNSLEKDKEGNTLSGSDNGFVYLNKKVVEKIFSSNIRSLASKNIKYKTVEYSGDTWFRISVPSFNQKYEWGEYQDCSVGEKWFTWGNKNSVLFKERAMFIKKIKENYRDLEFDISHNSDNSGQRIAFSKSYLQNKGITNPVFELKNKYSYERVSYKTNFTHYLVDFPHFSEIGIHEASTGRVTGYIANLSADSSVTMTGYFDGYDDTNSWVTNPDNMVDDNISTTSSPAETAVLEDFHLNSNNLSTTFSSNISKVEIRYYIANLTASGLGYVQTRFYAYFDNSILSSSYYGQNSNIFGGSTTDTWTSWYDITSDARAPDSWTFDDITNLGVLMQGENEGGTIEISGVELQVTYNDYDSESFYVNRTSGLTVESNSVCDIDENLSYYTSSSSWDGPTLVFPVSDQITVINNVTNNTCGTQATEVTSLDDVVNNTFWFDTVDKFVYIGTIDLTPSTKINWTVNGTSGSTFSINIPTYLDMGELCFIHGKIKDADGNDLNGIEATTHVYQSGIDMITPVEWNCTGGNVQASFYTTTLEPGIYEISMEFTKEDLTFKYGETIYIATDPPSGSYIPAKLHFSYYDSNTGLGISQDKFKLYVSTDTSIDSSDRIYRDYYEDTYTGQTLYYRVDDYFNNQIYPTAGDYDTVSVSSVNQWENIPIDWYGFSVKNMNHSIVHFKMTNGSRTYDQYLFPYEPFYWNVLNGTYTINLTYYDSAYNTPDPSHILGYDETTITIDDDSFYWILGYDLQDIVIEVNAVDSNIDSLEINIESNIDLVNSTVNHLNNNIWSNFTVVESKIDTVNNKLTIDFDLLNVTLTYLNNTVWSNLTAINSNINGVNVSIHNSLSVTESNLKTLNNNIWNQINITDSVIEYLNNTIWNELSAVNVTVDYLNNTIWTELSLIDSNIDDINTTIMNNFSFINSSVSNLNTHVVTMWHSQNCSFMNLENRSTVVFNFYNTNEGLGLDRETLKVYINGTRLIGNTYYCFNESDKINVTVKDYYNTTLYQNNFTITAAYTFLDLGLTFHSWLFGNKNDDYYMISLLKRNASRWWERGIVPGGEREFMIPSGDYMMRIYDKDDVEIYNSSSYLTVNNSRVYVIHGTNLSEIISGQSVIRGELLELQNEIYFATLPDLETIGVNCPMSYSVLNRAGMPMFDGIKLCPLVTTIATTRNSTYSDNFTSTPLHPSNGSTENGSISIRSDTLFFSGSSSWVNISYVNGTVIQNTSYVPSMFDLDGQTVNIVSSSSISVRRETEYQQDKKFKWTYYPSTGHGPDEERAGYHSAGITIMNTNDVVIHDVYCIVYFAEETSPDTSSVRVKDIANDGALLEEGDVTVTGSAVHFYVKNIAADTDRRFNIDYYKEASSSYRYDEETVVVENYDIEKWKGKQYNHFKVSWVNEYDETFKGALFCKLEFDDCDEIKKSSLQIYSLKEDKLVDSDSFHVYEDFIRIGSDALGDVEPGGGRTFEVYFFMDELPGEDPEEFHLNTALFNFMGFGVTIGVIISIVGVAICVFGGYNVIVQKASRKGKYILLTSFGVFVIFVMFWLGQMGV